ncbi:MAG: HPF/RaiA family ribosome-associated protein [Sphingomonadales bacterium]|nr:HPF/RaiA family ribosome-associated protein [Sphingomonadales bacterium]NCQ20537.1 HPF/RaiA family ribosome-associated protein [Sphingomonadales bacterium]NCT03145.1 HPF/RaiA family ribosome-associated protein [Sphingomonadales bacterium]
MDIRFNSDNAIDGNADLGDKVRERITERLETRFGSRLTTIEVHVSDVDGDSNRSDGVEAKIEARPKNGAPIFVSERAEEPFDAVNSALGTMVSRLDTVFGKADRHRA